MFNFTYDDEYSREFFYFRLTSHYFFNRTGMHSGHFDHHYGNWFPHDSKEVDFDKEASSEYWFAMSV